MVTFLLALAVSVETIVELFVGRALDQVAGWKRYKWAQIYVAGLVGIVLAFSWRLDIFAAFGHEVMPWLAASPTFGGQLLTGLAVGGGARLVHQLASAWFPYKKPPEGGQEEIGAFFREVG